MDSTMLAALRANFPVVTSPPGGEVEPPAKPGTRFVVGSNGLYREVSTEWLHCVQPIAVTETRSTPYGEVSVGAKLQCGAMPISIWRAFTLLARDALPNEVAALVLWNPSTGAWRLAPRKSLHANPDRVDYEEPEVGDDEVIVVDMHSHGDAAAYFSPRDDEDDRGGIKLSVVLGRVYSQPEVKARLVCINAFIPVKVLHDGGFEVPEACS